MIYLDNAATTFPKPDAVYSKMDEVNRTLSVNAGRGAYKAAKEAAKLIADTKDLLLSLFNAYGIADICFTPSVTHAVNQVLGGIQLNESSTVYITPYEHNAVARSLRMLQKKIGFEIELIPLTKDLKIDIDRTAYQFTCKSPAVVIVNKISNVTGYMLPAEELFHIAKKYGAITIMDAAQAAGLIDINMRDNDADVICFAGHKTLCGPLGIGGFALKHGVQLEPVFAGGTGSNSLSLDMPAYAPDKYEASSPNIVAIAGLYAALSSLNQKGHLAHVIEMTDYLLSSLATLDYIHVVGAYEAGTTVGIVSFIVDGFTSSDIGNILDEEYDIAVRTGYHCAPYIHKYLNDMSYEGTVRIGLGPFTSKADIDCLISALESL